MPSKKPPEFPVTLVHPDLKDANGDPATTTAATRTSLKVYESKGWKRAPKSGSSSS